MQRDECEVENGLVDRLQSDLPRCEKGLSKLPARAVDELTYCWMTEYFSLCGDPQPNDDGTYHIEEGHTKKDVYYDYECVFNNLGIKPVALNRFRFIWKTCTPHVLVRKRKGVDTKCPTCSMLARMWNETNDKKRRAYIQDLRQRHRITYMAERQGYWRRLLNAMMNPNEIISTIGDEMHQNHLLLPFEAGAGAQFFGRNSLEVHLQGVISHGRKCFYMFRHFCNVSKGANIAIHTWLAAFELEMQANGGKLPEIVYHQIDGGSENANLTTIAIAELMVYRGLCKKVVLTRLPVGHTHEDIDARFEVSSKRFDEA